MLNKLLAGDVLNNFLDLLMKTNSIIAIILATVGVTLACVANRVARAIRKTDDLGERDNIVIGMKCVGLIMIIVALVLILL